MLNYRAGTIAATAWNAARADKKSKLLKPSDFFAPIVQKRRRGLSMEEGLAQVKAMKRDFYGAA